MRRGFGSRFAAGSVLALFLMADSLHAQSVLRKEAGAWPGDQFGKAVAVLDDLDGDGQLDFLVGAPSSNSSQNPDKGSSGAAYVFSGATGGPLLYSFTGEEAGGQLGRAVAKIGDLDGDGTADFLLGGRSLGAAYAMSGKTGLALHTYNATGIDAAGWFGSVLASAGDVDNDSVEDIIIAAPYARSLGCDKNASSTGEALVFSGRDGQELLSFRRADREDSGGGCAAGLNFFGNAVAGIGDVNGDGRGDIAIGALGGPLPECELGCARVYSGADAQLLYTIPAPQRAERGFSEFLFGYIAPAGDYDADGVQDIIVGASGAEENGTATIHSGRDGSKLLQLRRDAGSTFGAFGMTVKLIGDINADGALDYAAGAYNSNESRISVYSGADGSELFWTRGAVIDSGDINGDGYPDILAGNPGIGEYAQYETGEATAYTYPLCPYSSTKSEPGICGCFVEDADGDGDGIIDCQESADTDNNHKKKKKKHKKKKGKKKRGRR